MTETWMTRREAALHLKVSTRQLDRLRLPRSTLGSRPRYSLNVLDEYLHRRMHAPAGRTKGGLGRPPYLSPARPPKGDQEERIRKIVGSWR